MNNKTQIKNIQIDYKCKIYIFKFFSFKFSKCYKNDYEISLNKLEILFGKYQF